MYRDRVNDGEKWLDEHEPNWWSRVDLGEFMIYRTCNCFFGQFYGEYGLGVTKHALGTDEVIQIGFDFMFIEPSSEEYAYWCNPGTRAEYLNELWLAKIIRRRINHNKLKQEASAGFKLLDEHEPDWFMHLDTERLDISDGCDCVLGQLHGCYFEAKESLGLQHGFDHGFNAVTDQDQKELTAIWREEIAARRAF
jgi:hypothetical protein